MTNVAKLQMVERGHNKQVVDLLRELLADAEAGNILSVVVLCETPGEYTHSWSGTDDLYKQLGAAARMVHVVNKRIDDTVR